MKIGITLYPYGENSPAGLARYIFDLTKALVENDPNNEYIIFLKENPKNRPVFSGDNWKIYVLGYGSFGVPLGFGLPQKRMFIYLIRQDCLCFLNPKGRWLLSLTLHIMFI